MTWNSKLIGDYEFSVAPRHAITADTVVFRGWEWPNGLGNLSTLDRSGTVRSTGLEGSVLQRRSHSRFAVLEVEEDKTDLNRDGDTDDTVLHVFDDELGTAVNTRLAAGALAAGEPSLLQLPVSTDERVFFLVPESDQGRDLNRDGDLLDDVLHSYDARTGVSRGTSLASSFDANHVEGDYVAFRVDERRQGADLNGDGDTEDGILFVADWSATPERRLLALSSALDALATGGAIDPRLGSIFGYQLTLTRWALIDGNDWLGAVVLNWFRESVVALVTLGAIEPSVAVPILEESVGIIHQLFET